MVIGFNDICLRGENVFTEDFGMSFVSSHKNIPETDLPTFLTGKTKTSIRRFEIFKFVKAEFKICEKEPDKISVINENNKNI